MNLLAVKVVFYEQVLLLYFPNLKASFHVRHHAAKNECPVAASVHWVSYEHVETPNKVTL